MTQSALHRGSFAWRVTFLPLSWLFLTFSITLPKSLISGNYLCERNLIINVMKPQTTKHKIWKKILVIVFSTLLFLLLAPVAYFVTCSWLFPGNAEDEKIAYIQKHHWRLDNNCAIKDSSLFSELTQPTVFMLGEVHGFSRTQILDAERLSCKSPWMLPPQITRTTPPNSTLLR